MEFYIFGGREFQIAGKASLKAHFDMLFVVDCCLRRGKIEKQNILYLAFVGWGCIRKLV